MAGTLCSPLLGKKNKNNPLETVEVQRFFFWEVGGNLQ